MHGTLHTAAPITFSSIQAVKRSRSREIASQATKKASSDYADEIEKEYREKIEAAIGDVEKALATENAGGSGDVVRAVESIRDLTGTGLGDGEIASQNRDELLRQRVDRHTVGRDVAGDAILLVRGVR